MKFFAFASLTAIVSANQGFPPYVYSVWVNNTGDITKPMNRCINVFSDDTTKQ